jgi:hypothetical protein
MFPRIVSRLSLSPSAMSDLAFYARRLRQESVTRTFSAIAAVLIVGLQFATIMVPPSPTNAASPNDIIYGGFINKNDLLNRYDGSAELQALYNYMGISRSDVSQAHEATINSRDHSLISMGRNQHTASDGKITLGSHTYWTRGLYVWDTGANVARGSTYRVLEGTRARDGGYFAVMFQCGNIVFKTLTTASPTATHTYTAGGKWPATLKVKGSTGTVSAAIPACSFTINTTTPPAAYSRSKAAQNLTQNLDATTRPAHAADDIRYTLTTKNIGGTTDGYTVVEHVEDILEYADITDLGGATIKDGVMTWPETPIAPGKSILKTFTIKVKSPIPATPVGRSDKFSYDLRMDNIYGNEVHINLEVPLAKQVEGASTNLPDTGASTATLIVLTVSALTLFFYFRNRQLMSEIRLLRGQYQGGGGYL